MRDLTPLCLLAKKHETDKGGRHLRYGGADSDTCHEYTPIYHDLLGDRREKVRRVLEVGVNAGSSLRMWREYFPNALIIGLDNYYDCLFMEERIMCILADQGDQKSLLAAMEYAGGKFDLIIDDGSHELHHQILTMNTLVPYLEKDGLYVVEDIKDRDHPNVLGQHLREGYTWAAHYAEPGIGKSKHPCEHLLVVQRIEPANLPG